jgi:DNA processing protein
VAVLGCGIDICYPAENRHLFDQIAAQGAVVTEFGLGERPLPPNFPERNRIIAGLSKGVLVIEASAKSGSLITAHHALEYGREVMALPGRIFDDQYKGTNALIREGAKLVAGIEDIVATCFPDLEPPVNEAVAMDETENYIYTIMGRERVHIDHLIQKSRLETKQVMAILTRLEMKDVVKPIPGGYYMRKV